MEPHPYPLSIETVKLTHWDATGFCSWLIDGDYEYYRNEDKKESSAPALTSKSSNGELTPAALEAALENGEIESLAVNKTRYAKPWAYADWLLKRLVSVTECKQSSARPPEVPEGGAPTVGAPEVDVMAFHTILNGSLESFLSRIYLARNWGKFDIEELISRESWSINEIQHLLWGRKLAGELPIVPPIRTGLDEWTPIATEEEQDRDDMQSPIVDFVDRAIGQSLVPDAGSKRDRFSRKNVVNWCKLKGIPLPAPLVDLAYTLLTDASREVLESLPVSEVDNLDGNLIARPIPQEVNAPKLLPFNISSWGELIVLVTVDGIRVKKTNSEEKDILIKWSGLGIPSRKKCQQLLFELARSNFDGIAAGKNKGKRRRDVGILNDAFKKTFAIDARCIYNVGGIRTNHHFASLTFSTSIKARCPSLTDETKEHFAHSNSIVSESVRYQNEFRPKSD